MLKRLIPALTGNHYLYARVFFQQFCSFEWTRLSDQNLEWVYALIIGKYMLTTQWIQEK